MGYGFLANTAHAAGDHPLARGVSRLDLAELNGRALSAPGAEVVARVGGSPAVAVMAAGSGEVVVLADLGLLGNAGGEPENLTFWRNLARYAR